MWSSPLASHGWAASVSGVKSETLHLGVSGSRPEDADSKIHRVRFK